MCGQATLPTGYHGFIIVQMFFSFVISMQLAMVWRVSTDSEKQANPSQGKPACKTKALELLADNVKQVMTMAAAFIAVTTTLAVYNKFAWLAPFHIKIVLLLALGIYFLSSFVGLIAHGAIIDLIHRVEAGEPGDIYDRWSELCMRSQQVLFFLGLLFTIYCGAACFFTIPPKDSEGKTSAVQNGKRQLGDTNGNTRSG